ncbi:glycosyltransferase family 2 protein [Shewanella sp. GXUN23E]|uniref:glycosyltransferase family 2 protein n=1 Tax=Shewanella sp. GXUN23E TaxID=3422498 RepID=UPI003D7DBA26
MLSVVLPAKDEKGNIGLLIREIAGVLAPSQRFEIVVVDDASTDGTGQEVLDAARDVNCECKLIRHCQSTGQSTAVTTGVLNAEGEWIVTLDADGQNDPADIPAMLKAAARQQNPHFCIAGYRKNRKDTAWKRFQSQVANRIRNALLHDGVPDTGCGLKLFPRETFLRLPYFDHMHRYLPALIKRLGGEVAIVEVNHRDRAAGVSKYNAWNRAWVGIVDLMGVIWLRRRSRIATIETVESHSVRQAS